MCRRDRLADVGQRGTGEGRARNRTSMRKPGNVADWSRRSGRCVTPVASPPAHFLPHAPANLQALCPRTVRGHSLPAAACVCSTACVLSPNRSTTGRSGTPADPTTLIQAGLWSRGVRAARSKHNRWRVERLADRARPPNVPSRFEAGYHSLLHGFARRGRWRFTGRFSARQARITRPCWHGLSRSTHRAGAEAPSGRRVCRSATHPNVCAQW